MPDLSPERRQQIEDEERQKHAEEQYRQQVRANLKGAADPPPVSKSRRPLWIILGLALIASPFIISMVMRSANRDDTSTGAKTDSTGVFAPSVRYVPVTQKIASGQVVVKARGYVQYRIQITPEMRNAQISGNFNASGGSGNDVAAVIAEESEFTNWINGHQARVFYGTEGKKTTDRFSLRLGPGTYIFAVSNTFSQVSEKFVFLDVDLTYNKTETY